MSSSTRTGQRKCQKFLSGSFSVTSVQHFSIISKIQSVQYYLTAGELPRSICSHFDGLYNVPLSNTSLLSIRPAHFSSIFQLPDLSRVYLSVSVKQFHPHWTLSGSGSTNQCLCSYLFGTELISQAQLNSACMSASPRLVCSPHPHWPLCSCVVVWECVSVLNVSTTQHCHHLNLVFMHVFLFTIRS